MCEATDNIIIMNFYISNTNYFGAKFGLYAGIVFHRFAVLFFLDSNHSKGDAEPALLPMEDILII